MKLLVLDEADLILEMGFRNTVRTILGNLPVEKQTLLFSATLGKNVHELGRVSLKVNKKGFLKGGIRKKEEETEGTIGGGMRRVNYIKFLLRCLR